MRTTVITITPGATVNDKPTLNHNDCHVSSQHEDQIHWKVKGDGKFDVDFLGQSPFEPKHHFDQGSPTSGRPTVPQSPTRYKYRVTVPGNLPLDPEVIVDQ